MSSGTASRPSATLEGLAIQQCRQLIASWGHDPDAVLKAVMTLQQGRAWFINDIALVAASRSLLPPHISAHYNRSGTPGSGTPGNVDKFFGTITRLTGLKFTSREEGGLGVYRATVVGTHNGAAAGEPVPNDIVLRVSDIPEEYFQP